MDYKTALQCAILSQEIYQGFGNIKFSEWRNTPPVLIEKGSTDTQLAILEDPTTELAVVIFRGSDAEKDWNINVQFDQQAYEWTRQEKRQYREQVQKQVTDPVAEQKELVYPDAYSNPNNPVRMHSGFISAYLSVRDQIHNHVQNSSATQYRITGHSLGGALANLCAIDLQYNFSAKITVEAYTFGAPKVGNKAFVESYNRRVPNNWRVVNGWDVVSGLPRRWQGYRHVDEAIKLARKFTWRIITGSFEDHRIDNYVKTLKKKVGRE
ncbi:MAG: lipase family protein [Cyanobacteria bacterium P01_G01_bin.38]